MARKTNTKGRRSAVQVVRIDGNVATVQIPDGGSERGRFVDVLQTLKPPEQLIREWTWDVLSRRRDMADTLEWWPTMRRLPRGQFGKSDDWTEWLAHLADLALDALDATIRVRDQLKAAPSALTRQRLGYVAQDALRLATDYPAEPAYRRALPQPIEA